MENNYVNAANDLAVTQGPSSQQSPAIEGVGDCPGCGSKLRNTKNEKTVEFSPLNRWFVDFFALCGYDGDERRRAMNQEKSANLLPPYEKNKP